MLRKFVALSAVVATVVACSSVAEAGKCRVKRNRRCCRQQVCHTYAAPCGVCHTPVVEAADAPEAPAEEAPAPPAEAK